MMTSHEDLCNKKTTQSQESTHGKLLCLFELQNATLEDPRNSNRAHMQRAIQKVPVLLRSTAGMCSYMPIRGKRQTRLLSLSWTTQLSSLVMQTKQLVTAKQNDT